MNGAAMFLSGLFLGASIGAIAAALSAAAGSGPRAENVLPLWRCGKCDGADVPFHSPRCPLRAQA